MEIKQFMEHKSVIEIRIQDFVKNELEQFKIYTDVDPIDVYIHVTCVRHKTMGGEWLPTDGYIVDANIKINK